MRAGKAKGGILSRLRARRAKAPSVTAYAVYRATSAGGLIGDPLYFSPTREAALLAIGRMIQLRHCDHYALWCSLRGKEACFPGGSWDEYVAQLYPDGRVTDEGDVYAVASIRLSGDDVAAFLRLLSATEPLALDSESDEEIIAGMASPSIRKAEAADPKAAKRIARLRED